MAQIDQRAAAVEPFPQGAPPPPTLEWREDRQGGHVLIEQAHCVGRPGRQFIYGGMALALSIIVLETACERPLIRATTQFLAPTKLGDVLELQVDRGRGRSIFQTHLTGSVGGRTVFETSAALGRRLDGPSGQWTPAPTVAPPEDCPLVHAHADADRDSHSHVEIRHIDGRFGIFSKFPASADNRVRAWIRPRNAPLDAAMLGFMADFLPSTTGNVLASWSGGTSLDNTIRIARIVPTDWALCEYRIDSIEGGIGHGQATIFAQDGTLMAVAEQSFVVRVWSRQGG